MTFDISKEKQARKFINNIETKQQVFNSESLNISQEWDPVKKIHLSITVASGPSSTNILTYSAMLLTTKSQDPETLLQLKTPSKTKQTQRHYTIPTDQHVKGENGITCSKILQRKAHAQDSTTSPDINTTQVPTKQPTNDSGS